MKKVWLKFKTNKNGVLKFRAVTTVSKLRASDIKDCDLKRLAIQRFICRASQRNGKNNLPRFKK